MESLSPQCTPLKRDYDNCFNAWFEGYLQPALESSRTQARRPVDPPRLQDPTPIPLTPANPNVPIPDPQPSSSRKPNPLSWSSAFPSPKRQPEQPVQSAPRPTSTRAEPEISFAPIDTVGKTRAQVKALEYEQACGAKWRKYRACLQSAIDENQSLSTMLQQARIDHPLQSTEGLQGTVWSDEKAT